MKRGGTLGTMSTHLHVTQGTIPLVVPLVWNSNHVTISSKKIQDAHDVIARLFIHASVLTVSMHAHAYSVPAN